MFDLLKNANSQAIYNAMTPENVNDCDTNGAPFIICVMCKFFDKPHEAEYLVNHAIKLGAKPKFGPYDSLLLYAVANNTENLVNYCLTNYKSQISSNELNELLIHCAYPKIQKMLLQAGANPNYKITCNSGANPNYKITYNLTPLMFAIDKSIELVKNLLDAGANLQDTDNIQHTRLFTNKIKQNPEMFQLLRLHGAQFK